MITQRKSELETGVFVEEEIFKLGKKIQSMTRHDPNTTEIHALIQQLNELQEKEDLPLSPNVYNMLYNLNIIEIEDSLNRNDILNHDEKTLRMDQLFHWMELKINQDQEKMMNYLIKPKKILEQGEKDAFERVRFGSICLRKMIEFIDPILFSWISEFDFANFRTFFGEFVCDSFLPETEDENISTLQLILELYWKGQYYTCFSVGITFLERVLGDLLLLAKKKSNDTSSNDVTNLIENFRELKINELLMVEEIESVLGKEFVFIFKCFSGPLQGLNLRNVVWHGFLDASHFPRSFASFLIVLIVTLAKKESVKNTLQSSNQMRRSFNAMMDIPQLSGNPCRSKISNFLLTDENSPKQVEHLIDSSYFIPLRSKKDWKLSLSYYRQGNFYLSFVLLFPHLEHALRRLFAFSNQNFVRLFSAETDQVYTTFDEILHPSLDYETSTELTDGEAVSSVWNFESRNRVIEEMGEELMLSLFDILFFKDGPRIRDKLSHGVVDPLTINKNIVHLCEQVITIALCMVHRYSIVSLPCCNNHESDKTTLFDYLHEASSKFTFQIYHPQMSLLNEFETTVNKFKTFSENTLSKAWEYKFANNLTKHLFVKYPLERGEKRFVVRESSDLEELIEVYNNNMKQINHESVVYNHLYIKNIHISNILKKKSEESLPNAHIDSFLDAFKDLSKTTFKPRLPLTFCGKCGNTQSIEFTKIYRLTDIVKQAGLYLDEIHDSFTELETAVLNRTAFARHRKRFVKVVGNMYDFYLNVIAIVMAVEFLYLSPVNREHLEERGIVLRLSRAAPSAIKATTFEKIEKLNLEWKILMDKLSLSKI
ncbi:hypothetical protein C9374_012765 [Naegleria lovaniensis]|uniref:DUF4209 domain-containing protein n=1 Tax=Naegleria lovaniensis TaxID=51637 RepID=A0AA88GCX1_NAELO|nr:uncharacterized protein C9374_012765 [Naegleria lovaniensis]KAG2373163.1 hypothetical protein C9374_012765 [Naegleria lovaniensis]